MELNSQPSEVSSHLEWDRDWGAGWDGVCTYPGITMLLFQAACPARRDACGQWDLGTSSQGRSCPASHRTWGPTRSGLSNIPLCIVSSPPRLLMLLLLCVSGTIHSFTCTDDVIRFGDRFCTT
jgi:hypothetical protein